MIIKLLKWLVTTLGTVSGVTVIQGFPTWSTTKMVTPLLAVELWQPWSVAAPPVGRIGQAVARRANVWRIYIFGNSELSKDTIAESVVTWLAATPQSTVDGAPVQVSVIDSGRHMPETSNQAEQYGVWLDVSITFHV
jgi:hypothetical protein